MPLHQMGDLYPYLSKTESPSRDIETRYWSHQLEKSGMLLRLRNNRVLAVGVRAAKLLWTCPAPGMKLWILSLQFFFKRLCFALFSFLQNSTFLWHHTIILKKKKTLVLNLR